MPHILAHSPIILLGPLALFVLFPFTLWLGALLPPFRLLQPHDFRKAGLPPLPADVRMQRRYGIAAALLCNALGFAGWMASVHLVCSVGYEHEVALSTLLYAAGIFAALEAVVFLLRRRYCKQQAELPRA